MLHAALLRATACLLVVALSAAACSGGEASFGHKQLLADAADGRLDQFSLFDAAVIAGGIHSEAELVASRRRLTARWLEVGQPLIARLPVADRPHAIFAALHRLLLTGKYRAECTELQRTLESGDYNCVTATVLYLELCRRHGLEGTAVAIPGHVYCRLRAADETSEEIQTTCKEWFEVRAGSTTSAAASAIAKQMASHKEQPRELSDVELLGKVFYNRGVSHLEAHDYGGAIALLRTSLALDRRDQPARNNLLAAHNNWALMLCDTGNYEAAAAKLAEGRAIDGQYAPLNTNDLYVHQKWVLHLCDVGQYSAALDVLEQGFERRPDASLFDEGRYAIYGMWSRKLLESGRLRDAVAVLDSGRQRFGDQEELVKQEIQAFEAAVEHLATQGKAVAAKTMLEAAIARHPSVDSLRSLEVAGAAAQQ